MSGPRAARQPDEIVEAQVSLVADRGTEADGPGAGGGFRLRPDAYLDDAFFRAERSGVFHHSWQLVADAAELAEPGTQLAVQVGDCPIVVIATESGLAAFHNICRHRGMTIVEGSECRPTLRCMYHGWEWDTTGTLVRLPQRRGQFPDAAIADLGLVPAAVAVWEGMVFVNPDAAAEPFEQFAAGLGTLTGSYRPSELVQLAHVRIDVDFNWKLFVENHIDVLHLWYLHDSTLAGFDHANFEHRRAAANWFSYEPMRAATRDQFADAPDTIRHIDQRDREGLYAHMLFPNTLMAASTEYFITYAISPTAPNRSRIDLRVRGNADADAAALVAATRSFIDEDIAACGRVQQALVARRFAVGPLASTHEAPILAFQDNLLAGISAHVPDFSYLAPA